MKTKRELLKHFAKYGNCEDIPCTDCPYYECSKHCPNDKVSFKRIGAMAILQMFPEKKKPLLSFGTKIKFDDGSIAKIESTTAGPELSFQTIDGYTSRPLSYLLGRTWEVVE